MAEANLKYGNNNRRNQNRNATEISLVELFDTARRHWIPILAVAVVIAVLGFTAVKLFAVPSYVSTGKLYINTERESISADVNAQTLIQTQSLMTTYANILDSKSFLKDICEKMNNKYTYKEMNNIVTIEEITDTNLLSISAKTRDSRDSYMICKYIIESAPDEIYRVFEGGSVKVIDQPEESQEPLVTSSIKVAAVGFVIGVVLMWLLFYISEMLDSRIKDPNELSVLYELPILGEAPEFESNKR